MSSTVWLKMSGRTGVASMVGSVLATLQSSEHAICHSHCSLSQYFDTTEKVLDYDDENEELA